MRYGLHVLNLEDFLGSMDSIPSDLAVTDSDLGLDSPDLPKESAYLLAPGQPTPGVPILLRLSIAQTYKYENY